MGSSPEGHHAARFTGLAGDLFGAPLGFIACPEESEPHAKDFLGIHQLARVERHHARRSEIWRQYDAAFSGLPLGIPAPPEPGTRHACHLYTLLIDSDRCGLSRDRFLQEMTARNIGVGVHYLCIADHPLYQRALGWRPEQVPNATRIGRQTISLPLGPGLSDGDVADVIGAVRACLDSN